MHRGELSHPTKATEPVTGETRGLQDPCSSLCLCLARCVQWGGGEGPIFGAQEGRGGLAKPSPPRQVSGSDLPTPGARKATQLLSRGR